jgi:hypothetical protein
MNKLLIRGVTIWQYSWVTLPEVPKATGVTVEPFTETIALAVTVTAALLTVSTPVVESVHDVVLHGAVCDAKAQTTHAVTTTASKAKAHPINNPTLRIQTTSTESMRYPRKFVKVI